MVGRIFDDFDKVIEDLEYAKGFKTHQVLFTDDGYAIGIGDGGCYIKIKTSGTRITYLRSISLVGKDVNAFLNALKGQVYNKFQFREGFNTLDNPLLPIGCVMNTCIHELVCRNFLNDMNSMTKVREVDLKAEQPIFIEGMKRLKAEDGSIPLVIGEYYQLVNKRILQYNASDKITVRIYDTETRPWFVSEFNVQGKNNSYSTFIKVLKVA